LEPAFAGRQARNGGFHKRRGNSIFRKMIKQCRDFNSIFIIPCSLFGIIKDRGIMNNEQGILNKEMGNARKKGKFNFQENDSEESGFQFNIRCSLFPARLSHSGGDIRYYEGLLNTE
jgi:hypothetical protein